MMETSNAMARAVRYGRRFNLSPLAVERSPGLNLNYLEAIGEEDSDRYAIATRAWSVCVAPDPFETWPVPATADELLNVGLELVLSVGSIAAAREIVVPVPSFGVTVPVTADVVAAHVRSRPYTALDVQRADARWTGSVSVTRGHPVDFTQPSPTGSVSGFPSALITVPLGARGLRVMSSSSVVNALWRDGLGNNLMSWLTAAALQAQFDQMRSASFAIPPTAANVSFSLSNGSVSAVWECSR